MENVLEKTSDGSFTLYSKRFGEHYHSTDGAYSESLHIYINHGLKVIDKPELTIFEVGFGTGLNALLTFREAINNNLKIKYLTIEKFPLTVQEAEKYPLPDELRKFKDIFLIMHKTAETQVRLSENFLFQKIIGDIRDYNFAGKIDLCFYDAFSYNVQPEMWDSEIFEKIYRAMPEKGLLVTYSSRGEVKRNLRKAGFIVKRFKGIGKKWHNLQAFKEPQPEMK